jgi:GTPase SAR1 family protein
MEARIKAAQMDLDRGSVSVSKELDKFSREVSPDDLKKLGYRQELNPFGNDETHRKEQFMIFKDAMVCTGCGSNFQAKDDTRPGFLPSEKYDTQVKLSKIEEMQKLQEKAEGFEWSAEDEIEWMIQSQGDGPSDEPGFQTAAAGINIDGIAEDLGLDLSELSKKKVICKRCHNLQNGGDVVEELRPGWTEEPLLSQEAFRDLLRPLREKTAVIIALVDLFDFSGSVLPELDAIVGDNPVLLAANKADLLPSKMGQTRAESWVRRELEYVGVQSLANVGGAVRLVSCKTGFGLSALLAKARNMAEEMDCDVYIIGAANAGKSSMLNFIMEKNNENKAAYKFGKKRPGNANAHKGDITTSPLPGTTLKFIKVDLGNGRALYDTPGLLVPGTLTQRLTPAELKMVVPKK